MAQAEVVFVNEAASGLSFLRRVAGAVRLEPGTWEAIARDRGAIGQAGMVALAAALASGVAAAARTGASQVAVESCVSTLGSWVLMAAVLWAAANGLGHRLTAGTAARLVGFAMAPFVLLALVAIPVAPVQAAVRLLAFALFLAALGAGTRAALRVSAMRAVLVCAVAVLVLFFLLLLYVGFTSSGP